ENYLTLKSHVRPGPRISRRGWNNGPYGYSPQQIATAYDFATAYHNGVSGAGQTIAIATAYGFSSADVAAFWRRYHVHAPAYSAVAVGGVSGYIDIETTLDLERAGAMADGARVLVYEAVTPTLSTFESVYNKIVSDNIASVVTTSWGLCEQSMPGAYRSLDSIIFAAAASQGQTWFAASGDNGAYDCGTSALAVDYPASDPNVGATGGTTLSLKAGDAYSNESAWSGSGGGLSVVFAEPSYQRGAGVTNSYSNGARQVADVALDGDPETGYSVYFNGTWSEWGGTSFAAPQWAAIFALANSARGARLGAAGHVLYGLANNNPPQTYPAFHDVTTGDNGHYPALSYWDFPTGWGSPIVWNLIRDLK
ncbi:MAG: S53 family peptidase, partial [Candidatus Binataceae bacterium]